MNSPLNYGEAMGLALCALYRRHGYAQYKMSKFEEYDLYARNKDFLVSDTILTFTDPGGRLMALKPDVTLSIVRNTRDGAGVQKVCYTENVYRVTRSSHSFREILQAGLECIGDVDDCQLAEVLTLACESLRTVAPRCLLNLSHLDILSAAVDALGVDSSTRAKILKCAGEKNLHELTALTNASHADAEAALRLRRLLEIRGLPSSAASELRSLGCSESAVAQLLCIERALSAAGCAEMLNLDFSVVNNLTYYNGVVFQGFVDGVPEGVLSGGQYDRLMGKMGRTDRAVGFAVYLDTLERLEEASDDFDADTVLLYDDLCDAGALAGAVKKLTDAGQTVFTCRTVPEKMRCRKLCRLQGNEVVTLESYA